MAQSTDEFRLVSPSIDHEGRLPRKYTQEGQKTKNNLSPPVEWYNVPKGTKSLALVVQDIDTHVPWTHWVVENISPALKGLPEGFSGKREKLSSQQQEYDEIQEGNNDWKVPGWRGPLRPEHGHRIQFKLFALDDDINIGHKVTKDKLLDEMNGHVLGEAVLTAVFP